MKKITKLLLALMCFVMTSAMYAQTITGTVNAEGGPLPGANVIVKGTTNGTTTDFDGKFSLTVSEGSGAVVISFIGYSKKQVKFSVASGETKDLGTITLESDNTLEEVVVIGRGVIDLATGRSTPIAVSTISAAEIQAKGIGNVELPEAIKSTPSVFVANQTGFGDSQLSLRGFDDSNTSILLNGQPINAQEDGRVFWSNWSGISDIASTIQVQRGLGASKLAISSVGGTVNIVMKAADRKKGGYFRALGANDSYGKTTFAYDTGINEKGWAFSVLLDHWQGHRKWARGTFGQGQNYYLAAGYQPNEEHSFNFLITGAPQSHGQKWSQNKAVLDADPKYNQHWGFTESLENGQYTSKIDSERRNYYHKPVANFNWDWNLSENSSLSSVLYASWGRGGGTGDRGRGRIRTADPDGSGPLRGQLDYAAIEAQAAADNNGIGNESGERNSSYARRASVNNHQWYGLISNFTTELSEKVSWNIGADLRLYRGDHFRQIVDLYGLDGWAGDRFDGGVVTQTVDANPWASLFNFADEDQRIDYDYSENINYQGLYSQIEYAGDKFSAFFQGAVSNQSYQRDGRWENQGKSDKESKTGYNLKGGISYKVEEMHTFFFNAGYYSRQPYLDNIFRNIRRSNDFFNPGVDNEIITGLEVGYNIDGQGWRLRINGYYTDWDNRVLTSFGVIDPNGIPGDADDQAINIFERGVNQVHNGVEIEGDVKASSWLKLKAYMSSGNWQYKGTTTTDTFNDDNGNLISSVVGRSIDNIKVTRAPQFSAGLGFKANVVEGLSVDGNIDYFGNHYLTPTNFNSGSIPSSNGAKNKAYSLTDLGLSYNFDLGGKGLTFRANVYNVFDEVRIQNSDAFGFFVTNGRTFNASMKYKF